jgi:hypothetical protein
VLFDVKVAFRAATYARLARPRADRGSNRTHMFGETNICRSVGADLFDRNG